MWMKWAIVNSLPLTSLEDPSMKVLIQFFSCSQVSNFLHVPLLIVLSSRILQTLLNRVTLLVRDLTSWIHSWTLLHSPLCLMTYYKRGSMFRMRTSFTIIIMCLPWVSPKMEGHFGWPKRFILWFFKHR